MEELDSCELGTKEYWESRYNEEIANFKSHGDPGEVWFGEDIVDRIIRWLQKKSVDKSAKIIDIGCGNGMLLIELASEGFTNLHGTDYSPKAIELAQSIAVKNIHHIHYFTCDILSDNLTDIYDIVHDKGTYDAISLSENAAENRGKYIECVHQHLTDDGYFIITSCNWTQSELNAQFMGKFELFEEIPTPQFKFGGKVGSVVTSIVYKKANNA